MVGIPRCLGMTDGGWFDRELVMLSCCGLLLGLLERLIE